MGYYETYALYLGCFFLSVSLVYYGRKRNLKTISRIGLVIPAILSGLRYDVGTDYMRYIGLFKQYALISPVDFISNPKNGTELGFFLINKLSNILFNGPFLMFFVMSLISVVFFWLALRRLDLARPELLYWLYLLTIFPSSMNVVRQAAAASIVTYGFTYIFEKKPFRYALTILLASMIHTSALFMLPVYFLRYVYMERHDRFHIFLMKMTAFAVFFSLVLQQAMQYIGKMEVFSRYSTYASIVGTGQNQMFYIQLALLVFFTILMRYLIKNSEVYRLMYIINIIYVIILASPDPSQVTKRLLMYLALAPLALLSKVVEVVQPNLIKNIVGSSVVLYGLVIFTISFFVLRQAEIVPYNAVNSIFGMR